MGRYVRLAVAGGEDQRAPRIVSAGRKSPPCGPQEVRLARKRPQSIQSHTLAMKYEIELQEHSIVAVGNLNPAIFQPAWFASEHLISPREAQVAMEAGGIISAQATLFQVDWLRVQVVPDRFAVATENEAYYRHLHDLFASIFSRLVYTPVKALGINYRCHYGGALWHDISKDLAPTDLWSNQLHEPRMRSLTMQGARPSGPKGYVEITVEPSLRIKNGMYVDINNHYDLTEEDLGCRAMLRVLESEWSDTFTKYKTVIDRMYPDG